MGALADAFLFLSDSRQSGNSCRFDRRWHGVVVVDPRLETGEQDSTAPGLCQEPLRFIL